MMDEKLRSIFDIMCGPDKPLVWIATSRNDAPHLVPVCFVKPIDDARLLIGNVFIKETERNIEKNPNIAVGIAFKREGWDGYLLKGKAEVLKDGEPFESFRKDVFERTKGKREINSALLVNIDEIYSLMPRRGRKRMV